MSAVTLLRNRNFAGLLCANTIFGTAFPIQLILGGLAGLLLAPTPAMATLPSSVQTLAGLLAAAPMSVLMGRFGRSAGFLTGAVLTLLAALMAVLALTQGSFVGLCAAHFLMGAGWAGFQYFRFAASEAVPPVWRPVAISFMLSALLIAALVGPQVFVLAKDSLAPVPFAGAYAATGALAVIGALPLATVALPKPARVPKAERASWRAAFRRPTILRAVAIAAVSQGVMVFLMVPTPIAMLGCGFDETTASDVVRWHIVAMFAPSFATGFLIKRFGAERIASVGLCVLILAAICAATGIAAVNFYGALILLGVGWNFGYIGATTMLDAAVTETEKAGVQGANDTVIGLVSTLCAFGAGFMVSALGWTVLAGVSAAMVCIALGVQLATRPSRAPAG